MKPQKRQDNTKRYLPWWFHLLVAILSYSFLKFFLVHLASDQAGREELAKAGSQAAPIIAIIFLLLAANALYKNVPKDEPDETDEETEDGPQR